MQLLCLSAWVSNRKGEESLGKEMLIILDPGGPLGSTLEGKCDVQNLTVFPTSDFCVCSLNLTISI